MGRAYNNTVEHDNRNVMEMDKVIMNISESSEKIVNISQANNDIAFKTNLVAVNKRKNTLYEGDRTKPALSIVGPEPSIPLSDIYGRIESL